MFVALKVDHKGQGQRPGRDEGADPCSCSGRRQE